MLALLDRRMFFRLHTSVLDAALFFFFFPSEKLDYIKRALEAEAHCSQTGNYVASEGVHSAPLLNFTGNSG